MRRTKNHCCSDFFQILTLSQTQTLQPRHLTTSPPCHLATSPPCHLATSPPCHLATSPPRHPTTSLPHYPATSPLCHPTTSPLCHLTTSLLCRLTTIRELTGCSQAEWNTESVCPLANSPVPRSHRCSPADHGPPHPTSNTHPTIQPHKSLSPMLPHSQRPPSPSPSHSCTKIEFPNGPVFS